MGRMLEQADLIRDASAWALEAASAAGVDVTDVESSAEIRGICELFDRVWGTSDQESLLQPGMLRALVHAGNYAAGAFTSRGMVGAVMGFFGADDDGPYLHSHILGVDDRHRGGNIGFALKQHQRAWALARGIGKVTWTFDPLVRRNAYFNVQKLGASAAEYLVRFYGTMTDGINAGDETDRLLIEWRLDDPRVVDAAIRHAPEPDVDGDATVALSQDGEVVTQGWGDVVLCATPNDVVDLRHGEPARAKSWRSALRDTLGAAMSDGYHVTGFTRSGWYVLERA